MTTASAVKKSGADKSKRGPLDKVIIDAGKNGFSVQAVYKPVTDSRGMTSWPPEEDPSFFGTLDEAFECARGIFGEKAKAKAEPPAKSEPGQKQAAPPADEEEDEEE
jgi:hypothetical protein